MELQTCSKCRKFFNWTSGEKICPACREALEKKFQEVKDFIRENVGATIEMVIEECKVEKRQIEKWIREERLEFTGDGAPELVCEKCGASISTGRYCEKCKIDLASGLAGAIEKAAAPAPEKPQKDAGGPRMHFLDKH